MKQNTKSPKSKYLFGFVAVMAASVVAQQGCGGDDETATVSTQCVPACAGGQACENGQCVCPVGSELCGGTCVTTNTDAANCGACGAQCSEFEECIDGECSCPQGTANCSSGCADIQTDKLNCGQCNQACPSAQECVAGACQCSAGTELCFSECVDTKTNSNYCGDCNTKCAAGEFCQDGKCESLNGCDTVPLDKYEANEGCMAAKDLPTAAEGSPTTVTVSDATLHHQDGTLDTDWFKIFAKEGSHLCTPLSDQCSFGFTIFFTPPDLDKADTYEMCLVTGGCDAEPVCTTMQNWNAAEKRYELTHVWQGTCGFGDDEDFYVKITRNGGTESCAQYELEYEMTYTKEECPQP